MENHLLIFFINSQKNKNNNNILSLISSINFYNFFFKIEIFNKILNYNI